MAVYIVTGKLGNGKTLVSVGRIRDKLLAGCIVATNLDLNLSAMCGEMSRNCRVIRLPDKPSADDLHAIGNANPTYDEARNGLLVLDECGTWFNSRNWQDKSRKAVNDWFLHARKLGWDVMLIVQDVDLIDSQARMAIAEHTVFCRRLDNLHLPIIGTIYKVLTGARLRLPRVHVGKVVYGISEQDPLSDRWVYRGTSFFSMYDTKQAFLADYPHGVFTVLPPWYTVGRYRRPRDWEFIMRMTKIYWRRFRSPLAMAVGLLLGVSLAAAAAFGSAYRDVDQQRKVIAAQAAALRAAEIEQPEPVPESAASDLTAMLERLRALRIVGSHQIGDSVNYELSAPDYRVSSRQLADAGIAVRGIGRCGAVLDYKGYEVEVYCF